MRKLVFISILSAGLIYYLFGYSTTHTFEKTGDCIFKICIGDNTEEIENRFREISSLRDEKPIVEKWIGPQLRILTAGGLEFRHAVEVDKHALMDTRIFTVHDAMFVSTGGKISTITLNKRGRYNISF